MNEINYASLEASKRLVDAGIVLETDCYWWDFGSYWKIVSHKHEYGTKCIPALSMAEVWRELPETIQFGPATWKHLTTEKMGTRMEAYYRPCDSKEIISSENPTDALIDLLIWVKRGIKSESKIW